MSIKLYYNMYYVIYVPPGCIKAIRKLIISFRNVCENKFTRKKQKSCIYQTDYNDHLLLNLINVCSSSIPPPWIYVITKNLFMRLFSTQTESIMEHELK